jgi:quercetin dioxygenase-like cupin family protein
MGFQLDERVAVLFRDGTSDVRVPPNGPPERFDGFNVGAPYMTGNAPHRGELHPDGDELLYVVSGRIDVIIEDGGTREQVGTERRETLGPGQAIVVPKGAWHRVEIVEPSRMVHITPGPNGDHRPL